jgi:hypothetical protein
MGRHDLPSRAAGARRALSLQELEDVPGGVRVVPRFALDEQHRSVAIQDALRTFEDRQLVPFDVDFDEPNPIVHHVVESLLATGHRADVGIAVKGVAIVERRGAVHLLVAVVRDAKRGDACTTRKCSLVDDHRASEFAPQGRSKARIGFEAVDAMTKLGEAAGVEAFIRADVDRGQLPLDETIKKEKTPARKSANVASDGGGRGTRTAARRVGKTGRVSAKRNAIDAPLQRPAILLAAY